MANAGPDRSRPWDGELTRSEHATIVLGAARDDVQRGWTRDRWHTVADANGPVRSIHTLLRGGFDAAAVRSSCLVAAVLGAAWRYSGEAHHSAPAIDALWNELQVRRGFGPGEPIERVCAPWVRATRTRDLIVWNDQAERTREDVTALIDSALLRLAGAHA